MRNTFINQYHQRAASSESKLGEHAGVLAYLNTEENYTFNKTGKKCCAMERSLGSGKLWIKEELGKPFKMYTSG